MGSCPDTDIDPKFVTCLARCGVLLPKGFAHDYC